MAGLVDEQKRQRPAGVLAPSGRINTAPNAPLDNPLVQIPAAVRGANVEALAARADRNDQRAREIKAQRAQSALMSRQPPAMQQFAQGQQQQQQRMNAALSANGGTLNPQQARQALAGQPVQNALAQMPQTSLADVKAQQQSIINERYLAARPVLRERNLAAQGRDLSLEPKVDPTLPPMSLNGQQAASRLAYGEVAPARAGGQTAPRVANAAPLPAVTEQGWGKTDYGANVVGRKTDNGYAFSNLAGDVQAAGNNRFKGRNGADGRISNNGSFNVMKSEDMWRGIGGNANPLAQPPAAPARYGNAERLPDSLQNIRSSGVNVVRDTETRDRNEAFKLRSQGEDLIRQGKNTRRARGGQQMVQAGTQMLNQAASVKAGREFAENTKAQQAAELESRERMNQGRQSLEQAKAASLEQQTQTAQQAELARQQQAQRLAQMQQLMADPSASPEQRQFAAQFVEMATFDPKRYTKLKGADNEYGAGGEYILDLLTGQPKFGGAGGQGGAEGLQALDKSKIYEDSAGRVTKWDENRGRWITSNPQ